MRLGRDRSRRSQRGGQRFIDRGITAAMRTTRQRVRGQHQHAWEEKQKKREHDVLRKEVNLGLETRRRISLQPGDRSYQVLYFIGSVMGKGERFELEPENVQEELKKLLCNVLDRRLVDEHRGTTSD